jgi:hypothetical protein
VLLSVHGAEFALGPLEGLGALRMVRKRWRRREPRYGLTTPIPWQNIRGA